jgi:hypothetical protein
VKTKGEGRQGGEGSESEKAEGEENRSEDGLRGKGRKQNRITPKGNKEIARERAIKRK